MDRRRLSVRQRDVASCVARGLSDKQIASELGLAFGTVKVHLREAMAKLGVRSRLGIAVAVLNGSLQTDATESERRRSDGISASVRAARIISRQRSDADDRPGARIVRGGRY